jgi:FixJ family two-component response regulator
MDGAPDDAGPVDRTGDVMEPERRRLRPVVCIVDDDESVRRALGRLIRSWGMRTDVFASPEAFLERPVHERIACLLLDVQLPGMDGFELRNRAVDAGVDSPVIFITARPDDRLRARAEQADAVAFLEKPFDDRALFEALEKALGRAPGAGDGFGGR